jgi:hypothetical protein
VRVDERVSLSARIDRRRRRVQGKLRGAANGESGTKRRRDATLRERSGARRKRSQSKSLDPSSTEFRSQEERKKAARSIQNRPVSSGLRCRRQGGIRAKTCAQHEERGRLREKRWSSSHGARHVE